MGIQRGITCKWKKIEPRKEVRAVQKNRTVPPELFPKVTKKVSLLAQTPCYRKQKREGKKPVTKKKMGTVRKIMFIQTKKGRGMVRTIRRGKGRKGGVKKVQSPTQKKRKNTDTPSAQCGCLHIWKPKRRKEATKQNWTTQELD